MDRTIEERLYWENAAGDPQVNKKYISDIEFDLPEFSGKTLEIGCGVGRLMKPGYYGIDISSRMIELARQNHATRGMGGDCEFKITDGRTIDYPDNYFDNVYCVLVFQHLPFEGVQTYIQETSRVLKHGGQFLFQYIEGKEDAPFSKHHNTGDIWNELLTNNFSILSDKKGWIHPQWTWIKAKKI